MNQRLSTLLFAAVLFTSGCQASQSEQVPPEALLAGPITLTLNPNDITPLAAEAVFTTTVPTQISLTVTGEEPLTHDFEEVATKHRIPILGLYPDTDNRVEIRITEPGKRYAEDTLTITTEPLPDVFPTIDIVAADEEQVEPGWTLSDFSVGDDGVYRSQPFIFDGDGVVRWYLDATFTGGMTYLLKRLANGNWVFAYDETVYEYDLLGAQVNRWEMPGYAFHHEIVEKPDGNFLVAVSKAGTGTIEDHLIELERTSGEIVKEWDFRDILDVERDDYNYSERDWFHMNALYYVEADDSIIVSGRNQGLVKLTYEGDLVWLLAPHKGWGAAGDGQNTADFLLTAVEADGSPYPDEVQQGTQERDDFGWAWGQHAPLLLPNGNLFVFDNGLMRNFSEKGDRFSRGVEYEVDESALTVEQVWQYGKERGAEFYSSIISDVDYLPETENRLIVPGIVRSEGVSRTLITEVTYPEGEVVFEAVIMFKNLLSTSDDLGFGQVDIIYRSERLPLYPE